MTAYDVLFDRVLARIDPERAHRLGFRAIRAGAPVLRRLSAPTATQDVRAMGLDFPSRLGLAAGFDKSAVGVDALAALGFGFVEVGTVTARPQPGNPPPRLFRLPEDRAIVNRMGFNNDGAAVVATRLAERRARSATGTIVGVNIGKTKVVPEDDIEAVLADYATSARLLAPLADYLVVNVSSPNTPGLRTLQAVDRLAPLLADVRRVADAAAGRHVPLAVKIAPDLSDEEILAVAAVAVTEGLDGVVATNTTTSREGLRTDSSRVAGLGAGGLSGPVLGPRSRDVLRLLREQVAGLTLISVGGITTADDARERVAAGADLVQAYTAFVYEGPLWPRRIARELAR